MTPTPLSSDLVEFFGPQFWPEDEVLQALTADLVARGPQIQVSPDEGRLLHLLVRLSGAERAVEVGTLFGYSAIWMARALPPHGHLDTIEYSDVHADAAEHWIGEAGLSDRVTVHRGAGLDVLARLPGPWDIAFFDAVKREYTGYLDLVLHKMNAGGVILADNVFWNGSVASHEGDDAAGLRSFCDRIASDQRLDSTVIAAGDGLSISIVKR